MSPLKKICVLGSLNIDMTISVPHFNQPGESVTGTGLAIYTGGKGGNQAIAAARLGAPVKLVGCLGSDANGKMYRDVLEAEGVDVSSVHMTDKALSGTALIEVVPSGENRIAVAQGANDIVDEAYVKTCEDVIAGCDIFMCQLENPFPAIEEGIRIAHAHGLTVILDPAPARPIDGRVLAMCDYITPNETELEILTGLPVDTEESAAFAARTLIEKGAKAVINKRGKAGCLLVTRDEATMYPGFTVKAVDTTAAGDSFNAGFGVGLALEKDIADAIMMANAVGAISTTRAGAQAAMPKMADVEELMNTKK